MLLVSYKLPIECYLLIYRYHTDPPAFVNRYLPSQCILIGTNATYNCSAVSEVIGNPQPNVTANVTQSEMDSVQMAGDTVIITGIDYNVNVTCIADNGIEPVATATASMNFGSEDVYMCLP